MISNVKCKSFGDEADLGRAIVMVKSADEQLWNQGQSKKLQFIGKCAQTEGKPGFTDDHTVRIRK